MKAQTTAIVASAMVFALVLAAVSGVTYSWFSDVDETDITVSSGSLDIQKVDIDTWIEYYNSNDRVYDGSTDGEYKEISKLIEGTSNTSTTTKIVFGEYIADHYAVIINAAVDLKNSIPANFVYEVNLTAMKDSVDVTDEMDYTVEYIYGDSDDNVIFKAVDKNSDYKSIVNYMVAVNFHSIPADATITIKLTNTLIQAGAPIASASTFDKLVDALDDNNSVRLTDDVIANGGSGVEMTVSDDDKTIDLNGNTLALGSGASTFALLRAAAPSNDKFGIVVDGGELTIANGTIVIDDTYTQGLRVINNGTLTLKNVDIISQADFTIVASKGNIVDATNSITIIGCDIDSTGIAVSTNGTTGRTYNISISNSTIESDSVAIYLPGNGKATIVGSAIEGTTGVEVRAGTLDMVGCVVKATGDVDIEPNNSGSTTSGACVAIAKHSTVYDLSATIDDCSFSGPVGVWQSNPQGSDKTPVSTITDCIVEASFADYIKDAGTMTVDGKVPEISITVSTADQLANALQIGGNIVLASDIAMGDTIEITKDAILNLNGFDMDFSENSKWPFKLSSGELTINAGDSDIVCGGYGIASMWGGSLTINGGNFTDEGNGWFIYTYVDGEAQLTLNGVNYTGDSTSWIVQSFYDKITVTVNGGVYKSGGGFLLTNGSIHDAKITVSNPENGWPAVYAAGEIIVQDCTIDSACNALAVDGGNILRVINCTVTAKELAFQVFSSGGTIYVERGSYSGSTGFDGKGYGTTGPMNEGCVAKFYFDGTLAFTKT